MTRIIKLEATGFKSFAHKTEFLFSDRFNCVIGPNGSGKSNLLDALCFVLGRTSAKSMRAEKSASLIYNGGKTRQPAKEGRVEITFSNEDKYFALDTPQVLITRIVKSNGTGIYKINGEKVTRQQVKELLMHARIDPDGHNIILQGDIIHMIDMSDLERRQVIEDVAGIGIYEERKQKTLSELSKVDQRLNDTEIILTEREAHIKELKQERDQAVRYKDVSDKINTNKALRVRAQIRERRDKIKNSTKQTDELKEKVASLTASCEEGKKRISDLSQEITAINEEIEQKGEKEQVDLQKHIESLKITFTTNEGKIESLHNELRRIAQRRSELETDFSSVREKIDDFERSKGLLEKNRDRCQSTITELEQKIAAFKKKNNLEDTQKLDVEIDAIDQELEEDARRIEGLRQKQQELFREKDQLEFKLQSLDEQMFKLKEVSREAESQLAVLKDKQMQLKRVTVDLSKHLSEDSTTASQLATARGKLERAQEEVQKLEAKQQAAALALAGNFATKEILEQKKTGGIKGIVGQVTELGHVKKEYAAALEVAASARIKGIVVESDAVAAKCIQYLKINKLGAATFLPLNRMRDPAVPDAVKMLLKKEGVYGLCVDLMKFDAQYKVIFNYVFGPTIVVKDVKTARSIGIGTVRMVTLDGDLIESSGAMSGGYKKASLVGAFKDEELAGRLARHQKELGDAQSLLSSLTRKKTELEETVIRHRTLKAELEAEVLKLSKTLQVDEADTGKVKEDKKAFAGRIKEIDKELSAFANDLGKLNKEIVQKKIRRQIIKDKVSDIRNPLKLAELNTLEEKRQSTREEIIKHESEIKSLEIQIRDIIGPEEEKIQKILKQLDREEEAFKKDVEGHRRKNEGLTKEIEDKETKQKAFYAKFKEAFNKRSKLQDTLKQQETKITRNEADIQIHENKITMLTLALVQVKTELEGCEREFDLYKDLPLPESDKSEAQIRSDLDRYEKRLAEMGNVNMKALEIYEQVEREYVKLKEKKETLAVEKEDILMMINEIETNKKEIFMKTFEEVNETFKRIFVTLSTKGEAFLSLEFPDSPFDGGMTMKVKLNTNKFMDIRSLSGGEKTMTALALLFAIQEYEPASFYVLDEVDAALDKRNSERLAELINQYASRAQYVIISHNDGVITAADTLFGASMDEHGVTKVMSLKV